MVQKNFKLINLLTKRKQFCYFEIRLGSFHDTGSEMQKKITLNSNLSKKPKNLLTEGTKKIGRSNQKEQAWVTQGKWDTDYEQLSCKMYAFFSQRITWK